MSACLKLTYLPLPQVQTSKYHSVPFQVCDIAQIIAHLVLRGTKSGANIFP